MVRIHRYFVKTSRLAFWCMVMVWVMEFIVYQNTINASPLPFDLNGVKEFSNKIVTLTVIGRVWLLAGSILVIKILVNKEPKGIGFKLDVIGLLLNVLVTLVVYLLNSTQADSI